MPATCQGTGSTFCRSFLLRRGWFSSDGTGVTGNLGKINLLISTGSKELRTKNTTNRMRHSFLRVHKYMHAHTNAKPLKQNSRKPKVKRINSLLTNYRFTIHTQQLEEKPFRSPSTCRHAPSLRNGAGHSECGGRFLFAIFLPASATFMVGFLMTLPSKITLFFSFSDDPFLRVLV